MAMICAMVCACSSTEEIDPSPVLPTTDKLQLTTISMGGISLLSNESVPLIQQMTVVFSNGVVANSLSAIKITEEGRSLPLSFTQSDQNKLINITIEESLKEGATYAVRIDDTLKGESEETFEGIELDFLIAFEDLVVTSLKEGDRELVTNERNIDIQLSPTFNLSLSHDIPVSALNETVVLAGSNSSLDIVKIDPAQYAITLSQPLRHLDRYQLRLLSSLEDLVSRPFEAKTYTLYTKIDETPKFVVLEDEALLDLVQSQTFKYFWDFGHPVSGLARERLSSGELVTSGGSGFGLMAMIVAVERNWITRDAAITRWRTIVNFLKAADRFHGAWPHWMNGSTGKVIPFSANDDGGDLVETAFLIQGLLTVRQYLNVNNSEESALINDITNLYNEVEWSWYTQNNQDVLYWHWSPNLNWEINLQIRGHNETQITYILAAGSDTYGIPLATYANGYARNGAMVNERQIYGQTLNLGSGFGGPLFFTHYSFLGLDPRQLKDTYADYWEQNVSHTLINQAYCIENPKNFVGYSDVCWGLTASDTPGGYTAHSPSNDRGVITPTAAISSIPYTPDASMAAMRHFYDVLGDRLWGEYGFYDAFSPTEAWVANSYLAIDQGPIICMIENHRSGLLWDLFMSAPEVRQGLDKLNYSF